MKKDQTRSAANEMDMALVALNEADRVCPISPRMAAREAYLAMFHAAQARIAAAGRKVPTTHKGVSIILGELYRGDSFHAQEILSEVERWKLSADYGRGDVATADRAEAAIAEARAFIDRMAADIGPEKLTDKLEQETINALRAMNIDPSV